MDNIFFGDTENIRIGVKFDTTKEIIELIKKMHPKAEIVICSEDWDEKNGINKNKT